MKYDNGEEITHCSRNAADVAILRVRVPSRSSPYDETASVYKVKLETLICRSQQNATDAPHVQHVFVREDLRNETQIGVLHKTPSAADFLFGPRARSKRRAVSGGEKVKIKRRANLV